MSGANFEVACADMLRSQGWTVHVTPTGADQGVDLVAIRDKHSVVIQCKLYAGPVGNKAVQEAHAARGIAGCAHAAVVTTGRYTRAARELASVCGVHLLHPPDLLDLVERLE